MTEAGLRRSRLVCLMNGTPVGECFSVCLTVNTSPSLYLNSSALAKHTYVVTVDIHTLTHTRSLQQFTFYYFITITLLIKISGRESQEHRGTHETIKKDQTEGGEKGRTHTGESSVLLLLDLAVASEPGLDEYVTMYIIRAEVQLPACHAVWYRKWSVLPECVELRPDPLYVLHTQPATGSHHVSYTVVICNYFH